MGFDVSAIDSLGAYSAWVGVYDEENGIAYGKLVSEEEDFILLDFTKGGEAFYLKYKGYNSFGCAYNDEEEVGLHNQMMMIYLFDDAGDLLIEKGFGTS